MRNDAEVLVTKLRQKRIRVVEQLRLEFQMSDAAIPAFGRAVAGQKDQCVAWQLLGAKSVRQVAHFRRIGEMPR